MLGWAGGLALVAGLASGTTPEVLDPVVVTANPSAQRASDLPYSVGVVDAKAIAASGPGINLAEALSRVPGVAAAARNNYAQDIQLSSRGFGARAGFGIRGLRLYEDGIPATAPDGQGQATQFDLANAQRIEVLRGPFSALYGNASGGVIALFGAAAQNDGAYGSADIGSFGLRQFRLGGEARLGELWNVRSSATRLDVDGFRPHSAASRQLYSVRAARNEEADTLLLSASHWEQPAQDPLGLTRAQFDADPRQTAPQASQFDTRKEARQTQGGAAWHDGGLSLGSYAGKRAVTQWLAIPPGPQADPRHSGGVVDFDRRYYGTDLRYSLAWPGIDVTGGLATDWQDEDRRGFENFAGTQLGVTGALRRDEANRVYDFDQYAQAQWRFAQDASTTLGLRHGQIHFRSQDHYLGNGDDSGALHYSYTNPIAGLLYQPASDWSLRASAGRGYETPTFNELAYRPDGTPGLNTALRAQSSRQLELGAQWRGSEASVDLALFDARTEDELVVLTNSGGRSSFGNAGRTGRHGAELGAAWHFAPRWRSTAALSWLDATYREAFLTCAAVPCTTPTQSVPAGNRIPGVPALASFVDLAWAPAPYEFAVEWSARSRVAVNDANSDFAAAHGLLAVRAQYERVCGAVRLRTGLRVDNLLDRVYAGSVIVGDANGRFFEPGAPRSLLLSLALEPAA